LEREGKLGTAAGRFAAAGGVLLIIAVGLVLRRDFAFHPVVWNQDMANFWLPLHCYLGKSLAAGHIPAWNPHTLSGTPFAADPQGGWLNLMTMLLFTTLPCGAAIRWLVVIQPIIAGVALYWFLREEEVSRTGATIGGLVLCGALAGSTAAVSIRFPGALAWTAVLLGCTSRYLRAGRGSRRVLWLLACALAWGQIAASQFGIGLAIGTGAWVAYLAAKLAATRRKPEGPRTMMLALLPVVPAFGAVNIAWFLPRLAYLPRLSLGAGYGALSRLSTELIGIASPAFPGIGGKPPWPIDLSTTPGRYLGGAALLTSLAALWSRRHRPLAVSLCVFGLLSYLASLRVVAEAVPAAIRGLPIVDSWFHGPHWTSLGVIFSVAVLGGLGVDAWRQATSWKSRAFMVVPGLVSWGILPLVLGGSPASLVLLLTAGVVALVLLSIHARWPVPAVAACMIVAIELTVGPFLGSGPFASDPHPPIMSNLGQVGNPLAQYLEPNEIDRTLQHMDGGRFMLLGRVQRPQYARDNEALTFGLESVAGYQSVQLLRYWILVRRLDPRARARYQYAVFRDPSPALLNLLQVNWLVTPNGAVERGAVPVAQSGSLTLYRLPTTVPRASLLFEWRVVEGADAALDAVAGPSFDPGRQVVLESAPKPGGPAASAAQPVLVAYTSPSPQAARVRVRSPRPGVLLIRNVWDPHWHAKLDERSVPLLRADYALQAVAVPSGLHSITLTYDDPTIGLGLLGSAVALAALPLLATMLARRERSAPRGERSR
jgi:hypothetical protein